MPKLKNEINNSYGKLTVIKRGFKEKSKGVYWYCKCSCGNQELILVKGTELRANRVRSCGCLVKDTNSKKFDLEGKLFGQLTVIKESKSNSSSPGIGIRGESKNNPGPKEERELK
mgnify:CR=1 FL=1